MKDNIINFLKEYEQLCKKYKIGLDARDQYPDLYVFDKDSEKFIIIQSIYYNEELNKLIIDDKDLEEYIMHDLIIKLF